MNVSEPKVIIDLKEYNLIKSNLAYLEAKVIELKSELRKANKTINSLKRTLTEMVKKDD